MPAPLAPPTALSTAPAVRFEAVGGGEAAEGAAARPGVGARVRRGTHAAVRGLVGTLGFVGTLSAVAALPGGPLLAFGWMLEAEGRIAAGGRGAPGNEVSRPTLGRLWRAATVLAGIVTAIWLVVQPVRFCAGLASDAAVIAPGSAAATGWRIASVVLAAASAIHLGLWLLAGGRTGWFRPLRNLLRVVRDPGGAADRLGAKCGWLWAEFAPVRSLWLGLRGLIVAGAWLAPPSVLLAAQGDGVGKGLARVVGALWLAAVLPLVPAAQANLAAARHAGAWESVAAVLNPLAAWRTWRARPARWVAALLIVIVGSLPLYLLAIVEVPRDARWLLTPACVAAVLPGRLLAGCVRRGVGERSARPSLWWCGTWLAAGWGLSLIYAGLLFLTPFTSAAGPSAALKQPGFFTPVPF